MKRSSLFLVLILLVISLNITFAEADTAIADLLTFEEISFESSDAITEDLALITDFMGWNISWSSTNEEVITKDGRVTRPAIGADSAAVTITATLQNGGESVQKSFDVTVLPFDNEEDILQRAKYDLTFESMTSSDINAAEGVLILPSRGLYGTVITWTADDSGLIKIVPDGENYKGIITNAHWSEGIYNVFLTATIIYKDKFTTKQFYITTAEKNTFYVYSDIMSEAIASFNSEFMKNNSVQAIRRDLIIPTVSNVTATYTSSNEDVLSSDGIITRQVGEDKNVMFTVKLQNGYERAFLSYNINVKALGKDTVEEYLEEDSKWAINYVKSNDSLGSVTGDISLPTVGINGSILTWTSSNPAVLSPEGKVTRGSEDVVVTLTVKASYATDFREESVIIRIKANPVITNPVSGGGGGQGSSSPGGVGINSAPIQLSVGNNEGVVFNDVPSSHWAYEAISYLYDKGIVNGVGGGSFAPDNKITREEFVKILVMACGIDVFEYECDFTDVSLGSWAYPYISTAYRKNIINGVGNSKFGFGDNITRQDIFTILERGIYEGEAATVQPEFSDFDKTSDYARNAVALLAEKGIVNGDNGLCRPLDFASRSEISALIYRVLMQK